MPEDKVSKFVDAITREAETRRLQMAAETEEYIKAETERAEKQAQADAEKLIQRRAASIRQDIGREASARQIEMRMRIFKGRDEIADKVFREVTIKLSQFRQSPRYREFLLKSAAAAAGIMPGGGEIKISLMEEDLKYSGEIENAAGRKCGFAADKAILFGGLRVECGGCSLVIDDTLDARLKDGREWFKENSGLTIE